LPSTIEQVNREYKDLGLVFYAVNIEESRATVSGFVQKHKLTLPVLLDPDGDASAAYHITATPTVYLIGRDGKLVAKAIGTKAWGSAPGRALLQRLLAR
jgi:peroxiredoxin